MIETRDAGSAELTRALQSLVARGVLTDEQAAAVVAEVTGPGLPAAGLPAAGEPTPHRRRSLSDLLIEVGLYVGSALVVAAGFVMTAQNWGSMSVGTQVALLAAVTLVTGALGLVIGHGVERGTARRRLAGVLLTGTAAGAAGTTALLLQDSTSVGTVAVAVGLLVMVGAQWFARSAITEIGTFGAGLILLQVVLEELRPEGTVLYDEWGDEYGESLAYDRLMPLILVGYGLLWALLVARRLMHREVAVFLGMFSALVVALPIIGEPEYRGVGIAVMAGLAVIGFWRFMAEGYWPWLAGAIASVTALVFFAVGGANRPSVAILVAGLVLLASSGLGMQVARRRRARMHAPPS